VQAELESTNKGLVRRNQEIQNFYHTLSHELKTPLTSAREFASLLMEGVAGPLNETQSEYLGIIRESCDQLRVCIDDLLDTTRLETGKLALELRPAPLGDLVQRVVTTMKSKADDHGLALKCKVQPNLPWVPIDECRMAQVVVNLLNNAFKFTPPGGTIEVTMEESPAQPEFLQVSVTDTGRGIPGEEHERIFDRLYQVKTGDATTEQGIGLGLYICQELIRMHGGEIWARSEPGKGSTFSFVIPKSQKLLQPNVLVIDDEAQVLAVVEMALSGECCVRTALDGEQGLKQLRQQKPDVVVLDLSMPNLNGLETLKQIRRNWDSIPIILHTAFSSGDLMEKAMEYSPFTLLAKPCPINQVRQTVRRVLRSADTVVWSRNDET
jgi:CheY-like chemotaxis protein